MCVFVLSQVEAQYMSETIRLRTENEELKVRVFHELAELTVTVFQMRFRTCHLYMLCVICMHANTGASNGIETIVC
jgi:hypothetical protein